jgi:hypothetical protein
MRRPHEQHGGGAAARPSEAPSLCPGEVTVGRGRNRFGREQWTWHVFRAEDGRLMCPYCAYRAFRQMQLKYHFMAQHVWLQEITDVDIHEVDESSSSDSNESNHSSSVLFSDDDTPYLNVQIPEIIPK